MRRPIVFIPIVVFVGAAIVIACTDDDTGGGTSSSSGAGSSTSASSSSSSASSGSTTSSGIASSGTSVGTTTSSSGAVPANAKKVFITSGAFAADFGGVAGADEKCAAAATAASLEGTFKAWLSVGGESAATRLSNPSVPFVRLDNEIVAQSFSDLVDGSILKPIEIDQTGTLLAQPDVFAWTNTGSDGQTQSSGGDCAGFTAKSGATTVGNPTSVTSEWTARATEGACSATGHFYCFEQ